jgi:hypothetical protein
MTLDRGINCTSLSVGVLGEVRLTLLYASTPLLLHSSTLSLSLFALYCLNQVLDVSSEVL